MYVDTCIVDRPQYIYIYVPNYIYYVLYTYYHKILYYYKRVLWKYPMYDIIPTTVASKKKKKNYKTMSRRRINIYG